MNHPPKIKPTQETKKITEFIAKTFKNTGKNSVVVPVSGGIDSATTLILTAKALSPKNIFPIHLPSKTTDPIHTEHALKVIKFARIPQENITSINITGIIQKTWRAIKRQSNQIPVAVKNIQNRKKINQDLANLNRLRIANIAARIRMVLIYDHAKKLDAIVIGTENKSEQLLGYYTRFGDEASDLEPIRHLYKTQLIELAKFLKIPKEILDKPPTAGLWTGQTDEQELGFSYETADPILYLHFEQKYSSEKIAEALILNTQKDYEKTLITVQKVLDRCKNTNFKHQVPYLINY